MLLGVATGMAAPLNNGGFESGNFLGWSLYVPTGVCSVDLPTVDLVPAGWATVDSRATRPPVEGNYFADLEAGSGYHLAGAPYVAPSQLYNTCLSQGLALQAGDVLSGWVLFCNGDPFAQDSAWVKILNGTGNSISRPWYAVSGGQYGAASQWTLWQWQAPAAGTYTLELGVTTQGDGLFPSRGLFDSVTVTSVPEPGPAAVLLLGCALVMLRAVRRRAGSPHPALRFARINSSRPPAGRRLRDPSGR